MFGTSFVYVIFEDGTFTYACSMDMVKGALLVSS
jgi:plastocyanin domain-containing protein